MDEVRPKRQAVVANLPFLGAVLLWLELVGAGWAWSAAARSLHAVYV